MNHEKKNWRRKEKLPMKRSVKQEEKYFMKNNMVFLFFWIKHIRFMRMKGKKIYFVLYFFLFREIQQSKNPLQIDSNSNK